MTNCKTYTLRSGDIPSTFHRFGIGFDSVLSELNRMSSQQSINYPPYSIVKLTDDDFRIEIAVAGFGQDEIDVLLDHQVLTITGKKAATDTETAEYLYQGISLRNFKREFTLAEFVEVAEAALKDGILTIKLSRVIPEEKKPKQIAIKYQE